LGEARRQKEIANNKTVEANKQKKIA